MLFISAALALAAGCARPLEVRVIDAASHAPIEGADVVRMDLKRPYFIVGAIVSKEQHVTDATGIARLKDRRGVLIVDAKEYEPKKTAIEHKNPLMTVELIRPNEGG